MSKRKFNDIFDESERLPEPDSPFSGYHFTGQYFTKSFEYITSCIEIGKQVLGPYEEWLEKQKKEKE